jgi:hypothetical protein
MKGENEMNDFSKGPAQPDFLFAMATGSLLPNFRVQSYKLIKIENDSIKIELNGEVKEFNNMELYHDILNLVLENKDKIIELSNHQAQQITEHTLQTIKDTSVDELRIRYIRLGEQSILITNKVHDQLVNEFYSGFRDKVFEILKTYI